MKWVATRPTVDPVSGDVATDARWSGASAADLAALETALQIADAHEQPITVITLGPVEAEPMLREALGAGATNAIRIDAYESAPSAAVARSLAECIRSQTLPVAGASIPASDAPLVLCGDWSLDRGSGSVPVFLAEALGLPDVCGIVAFAIEQVEPIVPTELAEPTERLGSEAGADRAVKIRVERRLDAGRREVLRIQGSAVLSVEGSVARLRRASLQGMLSAQKATIDVWQPVNALHRQEPVRTSAYRPRARVLDGPPTSASPLRRVEILTGAHSERTPPKRLTLQPSEAADMIVAQLVEWGYLAANVTNGNNVNVTDADPDLNMRAGNTGGVTEVG